MLDFEATCDDGSDPCEPQEIIEFPSVLMKFSDTDKFKLDIVSSMEQYVKPVHKPILTQFCTELTGITQTQVNEGVSFKDALNKHRTWLLANIGEDPCVSNVLIVTCGDWDLRQMLPKQCANENVIIPTYLTQWSNIKVIFGLKFPSNKRVTGMVAMLNKLGLPLKGRHHSGIDDCRNIATICKAISDTIVPTARLVKAYGRYSFVKMVE